MATLRFTDGVAIYNYTGQLLSQLRAMNKEFWQDIYFVLPLEIRHKYAYFMHNETGWLALLFELYLIEHIEAYPFVHYDPQLVAAKAQILNVFVGYMNRYDDLQAIFYRTYPHLSYDYTHSQRQGLGRIVNFVIEGYAELGELTTSSYNDLNYGDLPI